MRLEEKAPETERTRSSVSVVVPARNAAATLRGAVNSALSQEWTGPLEIVIAVGPSNDATAALAEELAAGDPRVRMIDNATASTGAGLNAAIAASVGDVIVRLDAHAELPRGYVRQAMQLLDETGAANVGGVQNAVGSTPFEQAVAAAMRSRLGTGGATFRHSTRPGPVDTVYLGVFRRAALEEVGGFNPELLRNQDYELNVRLRAAGGKVWFDPSLRVGYRPRASVRALARQYYDYGRWKREVLRRHPGSLKLRQAIPPIVLVANTAGLAVGSRWRPALTVPVVYAGAVLAESARARELTVGARVRLPTVFAVMHAAWGMGFLGAIAAPLCRVLGQRSPSSQHV
jgi:succinoglycan biosynthesis protein ExoA